MVYFDLLKWLSWLNHDDDDEDEDDEDDDDDLLDSMVWMTYNLLYGVFWLVKMTFLT